MIHFLKRELMTLVLFLYLSLKFLDEMLNYFWKVLDLEKKWVSVYIVCDYNGTKALTWMGGTVSPQWAWVPGSVPPQQILSLHVKWVGPQFRRPQKLRLPRCYASPEFSYSLTLREERSGSPVSAFICWVCTKHAVSPQVLRLPRVFLFLNITRLSRNAVTPQFLLKKMESSGDRPIIVHDFDAQKTSPQIQKIFTNFKNL